MVKGVFRGVISSFTILKCCFNIAEDNKKKQFYLLIVQLSSQNFRSHPIGRAHDGQRLLLCTITVKNDTSEN